MTELRWLIRHGWDGPVKVLQFRERSELLSGDRTRVHYVYTEWKDVPVVDSTVPGYTEP